MVRDSAASIRVSLYSQESHADAKESNYMLFNLWLVPYVFQIIFDHSDNYGRCASILF